MTWVGRYSIATHLWYKLGNTRDVKTAPTQVLNLLIKCVRSYSLEVTVYGRNYIDR